ncbi:hypothetical protein DFH08DRAFT_803240 [Mycena albidolilacea]|uniref:Uncharacterized protein n=1 Tax=Mycena albidolilacea TaxID=1033008 RepID=A0AAD7ACI9_9AGAR|nr:hypothetical protein DFH08DRAFT_803240 [Mycena albidolilacea]
MYEWIPLRHQCPAAGAAISQCQRAYYWIQIRQEESEGCGCCAASRHNALGDFFKLVVVIADGEMRALVATRAAMPASSSGHRFGCCWASGCRSPAAPNCGSGGGRGGGGEQDSACVPKGANEVQYRAQEWNEDGKFGKKRDNWMERTRVRQWHKPQGRLVFRIVITLHMRMGSRIRAVSTRPRPGRLGSEAVKLVQL